MEAIFFLLIGFTLKSLQQFLFDLIELIPAAVIKKKESKVSNPTHKMSSS
jgi:hypothetical protein